MEPHRGVHHRLRSKRQGLGGVLGGLVPSGSESTAQHGLQTPTASQTIGNSDGGIIGELTSLLGPGDTLPSLGHSSATTPTTPLTLSSSSSTGSTTTSTSSVQPTTSSRMTSTTTSSPSTTSTPTPTPTPTSSASDTVYTSSNGASVVYITSTLPAASATPPPASFLHNSSLEVGIFTLVGVAVLIVVCVTITWVVRKRRRDRLERDLATAVTFDPGVADQYERQEHSMEKPRLSLSSSSHGHGYGYGYGHGVQPAYLPPQEYHGPMGYGQYPMAAYHAPSSSALPYWAPSPAAPQAAAEGGANLTRKFSDRKPVPPLLPNPAYDPSNAHVSIPPQFYHQ